MVAAMRNDDARYDGQFFVCVKTTRIYCLPSCKAKLPKIENVVFLRSREEAVSAGFRGCKRCRSASYPDIRPSWLKGLVHHLSREYQTKIREGELVRLSGVDITTIRRYFKAHLHTTPMAFHRRIRLDHARALMARGADILTAGYESGFESASGFREAFTREFGHAPGRRSSAR
jgi:AraC family transcriptional regulator of adaptative response/methylated-DNA-[protein]-cysteine methyltransferase